MEYSTAATTSSSMYLLTLTVKSLGQHFQNTSSGDKKQHLIFYVIYLWNFLTFRKAACASVSTGRAGWVGFMASNFASSLAFRARSIFLLASSLEAVAKYTVVFQSHWGKKWWKERTCTLFSLLQKKKQQQHLICTCHARDMNLCAEQVGHQHLPPSPLPLLFLKTFSQRRFLRRDKILPTMMCGKTNLSLS